MRNLRVKREFTWENRGLGWEIPTETENATTLEREEKKQLDLKVSNEK